MSSVPIYEMHQFATDAKDWKLYILNFQKIRTGIQKSRDAKLFCLITCPTKNVHIYIIMTTMHISIWAGMVWKWWQWIYQNLELPRLSIAK